MQGSLNMEGGEKILFRDEQKGDMSLHKTFEKAKKGDFKKTKNGKWLFYIKDQTLLHYFASPLRSVKQLVVPFKHKKEC